MVLEAEFTLTRFSFKQNEENESLRNFDNSVEDSDKQTNLVVDGIMSAGDCLLSVSTTKNPYTIFRSVKHFLLLLQNILFYL